MADVKMGLKSPINSVPYVTAGANSCNPGVTMDYHSWSELLLCLLASGSFHGDTENVSTISQKAVPACHSISSGNDESH